MAKKKLRDVQERPLDKDELGGYVPNEDDGRDVINIIGSGVPPFHQAFVRARRVADETMAEEEVKKRHKK